MRNILLCGNLPKEVIKALTDQGFLVISAPKNSWVDPRLQHHIDLQCCMGPQHILYVHQNFNTNLLNGVCSTIKTNICLNKEYPLDAPFNICIKNGCCIYNPRTAAKQIIDACMQKGYNMLPVRQGYTACSTLVVGNTLITGDNGIARACSGAFDQVVIIDPQKIVLPGFDHGFIGGCGFTCKDTLYLFGRLDKTPGCQQIAHVCRQNNYGLVELCNSPLQDMGGCIVI